MEALELSFANRVRDLQEVSASHGLEPDAEGVEEYLALLTKAWLRGLTSA